MNGERTWTQKYAFYAASLYRLGNYIDAGLVSAIMFERYVEDEIKKQNIQKSTQGDFLFDAINNLSRTKPFQYNGKQLHDLRKIRNREIIHPDNIFSANITLAKKQSVKDNIFKITSFIFEKLDNISFLKYKSIENIPFVTADYAVMELKELLSFDEEKTDLDQFVRLSDFENLFSMRSKIIKLAKFTKVNLLSRLKNIDVNIISKVDTTSAYIWLAANFHKVSEDGSRDRIGGASASFLATPLDFRVYMDFGGEAVAERKIYYDFLRSGEYEKIKNMYADSDLQIFDIDWYSFIVNRDYALNKKEERLQLDLKDADLKLMEYLKSGKIVTWNRCLIGYIFDRRDMSFGEILNKFEIVIKIYYLFEKYRAEKTNNSNISWIPRDDYLLDCKSSVLSGYKNL